MENIQRITLDIMDNHITDYLYLKQYDIGRTFIFSILNNGEEYDLTDVYITIQIKKPDGTVILENCNATGINTIEYVTSEQVSVCCGIGNGQILLSKDNKSFTTINFKLKIGESVVKDDDVESSDEFGALVDALNRVTSDYSYVMETVTASTEEISQNTAIVIEKVNEANESADIASQSANTATTKANEASESEAHALEYKNQADAAATNINNNSTRAESYAKGGTGTRENENIDNAQYYYQQAKAISESFAGALRPMGTVTFSNLPNVSLAAAAGDMYNVSDEFTTTNDFVESSGNLIPAGANVYKTTNDKWDVLAGTPVSGVKGSAENTYRTGNVNLTADDVNAVEKGGDTATNITSFTSKDALAPTGWTTSTVLESGETHSSVFNKVSIMFKNIRYLFLKLGTTDISSVGDGTVMGAISTLNTNKQGNIIGGATSITDDDLTANKTLISDENGKVGTSDITNTELGYLSGVTSNIQSQFDNMWKTIYPVGYIYMSVTNSDPSTLFGGTWVQLENRFLLGAGSNYTAGATGGESEHTLTTEEMPAHTHDTSLYYINNPDSSARYVANWTTSSGATKMITGTKGGSQAHNNMPPYLVVYMWKRTA